MSAKAPIQLLTFLGTGGYKPCAYALGGARSGVERYAQAALVELLDGAGAKPAIVTVCLTDEARERNWRRAAPHHAEPADGEPGPGLAERLEQLGCRVEAVEQFPVGRSEDELWAMFRRIAEAIAPEHELVVDITHGFRCFPAVLCLALAFLQQARDLRVRAVYYGAFDAGVDDVAPFLDLSPMLGLLAWSSALERLRWTGDARGLAELAAAGSAPDDYTTALTDMADAVACGAAKAIAQRATVFAATVPGPEAEPSDRDYPWALARTKVDEDYAKLAAPSEALDDQLRGRLAAVRLLFDHGQLHQAYTLLKEALGDILDHLLPGEGRARITGREGEVQRYGATEAYAESLASIAKEVGDRRNPLDHAWCDHPFHGSEGLRDEGLALAARFERELLPVPTPRPAAAGRRMLVVMNHPLTPEQEAQARECLGVTEFVYPSDEDRRWLGEIPPDIDLASEKRDTAKRLSKVRKRLEDALQPGDCALLHGEPGVTFYLVRRLRQSGIECYHATTERKGTAEPQPDGSVTKSSVFRHVRLRPYID